MHLDKPNSNSFTFIESSVLYALCYVLRVIVYYNNGFDFFATTLTLSPYKKADWINKIGGQLDKEYKSKYLYSDFKKRNGYKRSIELSYQYNLYRQDYCGCIYSLRK